MEADIRELIDSFGDIIIYRPDNTIKLSNISLKGKISRNIIRLEQLPIKNALEDQNMVVLVINDPSLYIVGKILMRYEGKDLWIKVISNGNDFRKISSSPNK
jgi:hypothetical protein